MNRRIRSLFAKLLVVSLLGGMFPSWTSGRVWADSPPPGELLAETFDSLAAGDPPGTGWTVPAAPDPVQPAPSPYISALTVVDLPGESGKGLKLEKNGKSTATFTAKRSFTGVTKSLLRYRVKANQTNAIINLPTPQSSSGTNLIRMSLNNGSISIWKNSAWTGVKPYQAGVWYDIQVAIDTTNKKYDVYVDDVLVANQETVAASSAMAAFTIGVYSDSAGSAYFDDFNLYTYKPTTGLSFTESSYELPKWESIPFSPLYAPTDATFRSADWSSSNPAVASVDPQFGIVTGNEVGTATITAAPTGGAAPVSVTVTVIPSPYAHPPGNILAEKFEGTPGQQPSGWIVPAASASVIPSVEPSVTEAVIAELDGYPDRVLKMRKNARSVDTFTIRKNLPANAAKAFVQYSVMAEQLTQIVNLPSPIGTGSSATVYLAKMALFDGKISMWKNAVWNPIQPFEAGRWYDIGFAIDTVSKKYDLYIDGVLKVAQESSTGSGQLTALETGLYKDSINTAYIDNLNVYAYKEAVGASFAQPSVDVALHSGVRLPLEFQPDNATFRTAVWSSSNESVAAVDFGGNVTGRSPGTAVITAVPYGGTLPSVTVAVNVYEVAASSVTMSRAAVTVPAGSATALSAEVSPAGSTDTALIWHSADPGIATVDDYGEVTGVSPGSTTVYATTAAGGVQASSVITVAARSVQQSFYVSPQGSDVNAGTEQSPFRTLERAKAAVRLANGSMTGDIVVYLRGGTYTLDSMFELDDRDSGTNGYAVTYRSYPGEQAVISGGKQASGWQLVDSAKQIYKTYVGAGTKSRQLYIDGVRAVRARSAGGLTNPVMTNKGYMSDDPLLATLQHPEELEFVYYELWTNPRVGVQSITASGGKADITMRQEGWLAASNKGSTSITVPAYYENAYELIDEPGEWYMDASGYVYYKPRSWENMSTAVTTVPVVEKLVTVAGRDLDRPARDIRFEGLSFAYTTWLRPSTDAGHSDAQNNYLRYPGRSDFMPDAAVTVERANSIGFTRNDFSKLGITALKLVGGVQNSSITGNRFYDISGGAISVGEQDHRNPQVTSPDDSRLWMKNNDVTNNYIHDIGVDFQSAAAISAGFPLDMDISHNVIFDIPYSGLHIGYGWANQFPVITKNVKIEGNFIHDLLGDGVRDGGGIYMLGATGGTAERPNVVSGNYILNQFNDSGAIYPDEGSSNWGYYGNVIDLKNSPAWHNSAPKWAHVWKSSIHDLVFDGNYSTTSLYRNEGTNTVFTNTYVQADAQWPAPALAIIAGSGLTGEYSDIAGQYPERLESQDIVIDIGGQTAASLSAYTGKGTPVPTAGQTVYYRIADALIASVDQNGIVTGLTKGKTKLEMTMVSDGIVHRAEITVWVGESIASLSTDNPDDTVYLTTGEPKTLNMKGISDLGRTLPLDSIRYESSHPALVSVDGSGTISASAAGSAALIVNASYRGATLEKEYHVQASAPGQQIGYPLSGELADAGSWYTNSTGAAPVVADSTGTTFATPGGFAMYQGRRYAGERMSFDMTLQGTSSSWFALVFRSQKPDQDYDHNSLYMLTVKSGAIELHRFNEGARTVIYGTLTGYTSLAGEAIPNTAIPFGQERHIELGAFNELNGVRLVLNVNGADVFNYLDTSAAAIREAGYTGVYTKTGSLRLAKQAGATDRVTDVHISGAAAMAVGSSRQSVVMVTYGAGSVAAVTYGAVYTSSIPAVATVSAAGVVTALSEGDTVISATYGGITSAFLLHVGPSGMASGQTNGNDGTEGDAWNGHQLGLPFVLPDSGRLADRERLRSAAFKSAIAQILTLPYTRVNM